MLAESSAACASVLGLGDYEVGDPPAPSLPDSATSDVVIAPLVDAAETGPNADVAVSPCLQRHTFCDDFDTGETNLALRWDEIVSGAGPLTLNGDAFVSAPRALVTQVAKGDGDRYSAIRRNVPMASGKAHVEADVLFSNRGSRVARYLYAIELQMRPGPPGFEYHALYFLIDTDGAYVEYFGRGLVVDGGQLPDFSTTHLTPYTMGRWAHVTFDYDSSRDKAILTVDGATFTFPTRAVASTSLRIAAGAPYARDIEGEWTTRIDNVVVDIP